MRVNPSPGVLHSAVIEFHFIRYHITKIADTETTRFG